MAKRLTPEEVEEQVQIRITEIMNNWYFWGKVPADTKSTVEGLHGSNRRDKCFHQLDTVYRLDQLRIETFTTCKDVIPLLGTPEPEWVGLIRTGLHPTASADQRDRVRKAIFSLKDAFGNPPADFLKWSWPSNPSTRVGVALSKARQLAIS